LLLLLGNPVQPVFAQFNPLTQQQVHHVSIPRSADTHLAENETESVRINTQRIQLHHSSTKINMGMGPTIPVSQTTAPLLGPMTINPLFQSPEERTSLPPLPLRQNDEYGSKIEPVVPIGSYSQPIIEGNSRPRTFEDKNPIEPKSLKMQDFGSALQATIPEAAQIDEIIQRGAILEKEGRWNEALILYENAIRTFHKPPVLMQRFRLARFHHDLTKRYHDPSFEMLLRRMSYSDALALFDEVISKIQQSHVEPPHWNELFENGIHDFEIALSDPAFCQRHFPNIDMTRVRSLGQKIVQTTQGWEIRDPRTLRAGIVTIADNCQKEIGLHPTAVVLEFLAGMTNSLDPYTEFMTLNQFNDTNCMMSGNFVGLGVELKMDRKSLYINRVIPGSPAEKGGLKSLDRILVVDGSSTEGLPLETASNLLQGEAETTVRLLVQSGTNAPREMLIQREHLKVPSVENVHILDEYGRGSGIGYFKLTGFQRDTVQEIHEALLFLNRQGMKSLIIDLRGNAGGVLTECIGAADLFLKQGVIVRTKTRGLISEYVYSATQSTATWDIPLAVLIDKDSASASEIFAGAILDNNRGLIVGQPSFGKDTVQAVIPLTGGKSQNGPAIAGLKLTIETYYSPNGISFYGIGVQPNVLVSSTMPWQVNRSSEETINTNLRLPGAQEDKVLQSAIDALQVRSISSQVSQNQPLARYQPSMN